VIHRRLLLATVSLTALVSLTAAAQSYPTQRVKIILGFPAGGPSDTVVRLLANHLTTSLGQPAVVENRPGASGTIASKAVAGAEPDGHTLMFGGATLFVTAPFMFKNLDYDPIKSFAPVALVSDSPMVLVVNPALPVKSVKDLVAFAKANPGKLNFASAGNATPPHLTGELFKSMSGTDIVHVPYRGGAPSINDLVAGQVQMTFQILGVLRPLVEAGKLRALAVADTARASALPDVPTMIESGFPDFLSNNWTALVAPAKTPDAVIAKLNSAVNDALKRNEVRSALEKLGFEAKGGPPQALAQLLANDARRWTAVAKAAGLIN
jgi:tripartite-type tricarboxylate transporter receptor subunit TctC